MEQVLDSLMRCGVAAKKLRKAVCRDGLPDEVNEKELAASIDKLSTFMDELRGRIKRE